MAEAEEMGLERVDIKAEVEMGLEAGVDMVAETEETGREPGVDTKAEAEKTGLEPVVDTKAEAEKMGLEPVDLPNEPERILSFPFDPKHPTMGPLRLIAQTTVQIVRDKRQLTTKEYQVIGNILKALSSIAIFTTENVKLLEIDWVVTCILGEAPNARGPYEYPESFQKVAVAIQARLDEEVSVQDITDVTSPSATTGEKAKRRSSKSSRSVAREPPDTYNPRYQGIMRGIVVGNSSYKLADKSTRVPANVFGHNGLQVGDWWPKWICALRDGAHGHTQGGIYSRLGVGTFSIVVSGLYDDLDKDYGSTLYYSGNKSHDNVDSSQAFITPAIRALQQSHRDQRPIRVLRSSGGKAAYSPVKGLRYDGLYRIIDQGLAYNSKGGLYVRFKLVREPNQPDIDLSRPTQEERAVWDRLGSSI